MDKKWWKRKLFESWWFITCVIIVSHFFYTHPKYQTDIDILCTNIAAVLLISIYLIDLLITVLKMYFKNKQNKNNKNKEMKEK